MRSRLGQGDNDISFTAICDADMVGHLNRVITWAGGSITRQEDRPDGVILHIIRNIQTTTQFKEKDNE